MSTTNNTTTAAASTSATANNETVSRGLAALEFVDAIKHKITDQEYKKIVESLQVLHREEEKYYKVQYQLTQSYIKEDVRSTDLITSESTHNVIVLKCADTRPRHIGFGDYNARVGYLLMNLRNSIIEEFFFDRIKKDISEKGFSSCTDTEDDVYSSEHSPWCGSSDGNALMTKIMIVKCEEYNK
jgi:hypothetical protein